MDPKEVQDMDTSQGKENPTSMIGNMNMKKAICHNNLLHLRCAFWVHEST